MSDTILVAVPDLIFRAKIVETARQVGRRAVAATSRKAVLERAAELEPGLVVVDLDDERIEPFDTIRDLKADPQLSGARVLGYFSHVHIEERDLAREAGCDRVVPRSSFVAGLPTILETLGAAGGRGDRS